MTVSFVIFVTTLALPIAASVALTIAICRYESREYEKRLSKRHKKQ